MIEKVMIIYPLYYSPYSLIRLSSYLSQASSNIKKDVAIFCSNREIEEIAREFSNELNFGFYLRDNFGGGEGVFLELKRIANLEKYDYIIYLEESCEPISRHWLEILLRDLRNGSLITGWHWNWRGKKRKNSILDTLGTGTRLALGYWNNAMSLPSNVFQVEKVLDAPGFRHECIAFHRSALGMTNIGVIEKKLWCNNDLKKFGLAMERFYWDSMTDEDLISPNIQYHLLRNEKILPKFTSKNYKFFQELKENEKNTAFVTHYEWKFRRKRLFNLPKLFAFKIHNFVKFVIVTKFRIDLDSKMKDSL